MPANCTKALSREIWCCALLKKSKPVAASDSPRRTAVPEKKCGTTGELDPDEGAERAVRGLRASIELQAAERTEARVVLAELARRRDVVLEARAARDTQAGVRARECRRTRPRRPRRHE